MSNWPRSFGAVCVFIFNTVQINKYMGVHFKGTRVMTTILLCNLIIIPNNFKHFFHNVKYQEHSYFIMIMVDQLCALEER